MTTCTLELPTELRSFFDREGYLSIPAITTAEEVAWIRERLERLFAERAGWEGGDMFDFAGTDEPELTERQPQLLSPSKYDPALAGTLFRANATALARHLLGPDAELVFEHAMLKPVGVATPTPWHQDQAFYRAMTRYRSLTIWMPLQETPDEAGCLRFIPGSHRDRLLQHRSIGDDPRKHGLEAVDVDETGIVSCPLPAGGATVHHYLTLHSAGPNLVRKPRLAYALAFGIRSALPVVWVDYPWNAEKQTARDERERLAMRSSLSPKGVVRTALHLRRRAVRACGAVIRMAMGATRHRRAAQWLSMLGGGLWVSYQLLAETEWGGVALFFGSTWGIPGALWLTAAIFDWRDSRSEPA
jgi:ectoine hydroxylase-related dioxygenase (phytanoyl-CoA dioxygenase family)